MKWDPRAVEGKWLADYFIGGSWRQSKSGNRPILPKCIGVQDGSVHSARERSILLSEPEGDAWAGPGL